MKETRERCVECGHFICPDDAPSPSAPGEVGERLAARLHQHPGKITVDRELIGEIRDVLGALASATAEVERLRKSRNEYERQIASRDRTIKATSAALAAATAEAGRLRKVVEWYAGDRDVGLRARAALTPTPSKEADT
jgi:hypothetical protein